ncbi:MAG: subfamily B ATP-binding cassette protein HlyB/CyaB [Oleispira sp.]|jgi:subfamily B ATP-binding cassette protein HlyB/CyaB
MVESSFNGAVNNEIPSGLLSFAIVMHILKQPVNIDQIKHEYCPTGADIDSLSLLRAAKASGCKAKRLRVKPHRLAKSPFPIIAQHKSGSYFVIGSADDDKALIQIPGEAPTTLNLTELWDIWSGEAIFISHREQLTNEERKFDITWFIPIVVRFKRLFGEVLIASLFIQLFALITPLMFQIVMDKVLAHQGYSTLNVVVVALIFIAFFDVLLNGLRTYVFAHTTSRVDVALGARLFDHLMKLPIAYFSSRPVGQVVARVRELETIRSFLTGNALTAVIDLLFTGVFFAVMYHYSPTLTYIVLASIPVYVLVSVSITPTLRARTEEKFQRGAINQAFLTESVSGVETIKSMAVEPQMKQKWEGQLAAYVKSSFKAVAISNIGSQAIQFISKVVTALLLWQGAQLVMAGELTVGQLIAFNMLAGQVAQPILRLSQLWQDFQQFKISLDRLGDILNVPAEPTLSLNRPSLPNIKGKIQFENVIFRYAPNTPEVLRNINLKIEAGQTIGIVGTSGSGKSTLTKLIQRLYVPEQGKVLVDGTDLSVTDPSWLRRQVGVVLQENILFDVSVRDNIALTNPNLSMEKVIAAANLAGAHDFILELPEAYDTKLGERGNLLSGGQRQRIAIARALVDNPAILIFDEATSALDYESESIIQENMHQITKGRTVIIIAHRLSAVRDADRIITLDRGEIIEDGTHEQLMNNPKGRYFKLYNMQSRNSSNERDDQVVEGELYV